MTQTQIFRSEIFSLSSRDGNCRRFSRSHKLERNRMNFDIARLEIRIPHLGGTQCSFTLDEDNRLLPQCCCFLDFGRRCPLRIERNLNDSRSIAKIEEDYSTEISRAMNPTCKRDLLTRVLRPERACEMAAKGGFGCRIDSQSAISRRRDGNSLNLNMAYSWWKDCK